MRRTVDRLTNNIHFVRLTEIACAAQHLHDLEHVIQRPYVELSKR